MTDELLTSLHETLGELVARAVRELAETNLDGANEIALGLVEEQFVAKFDVEMTPLLSVVCSIHRRDDLSPGQELFRASLKPDKPAAH